ncbi:MAG: efflux RND transporter periplasmic adaptor subunit [Parahaliea sp.]
MNAIPSLVLCLVALALPHSAIPAENDRAHGSQKKGHQKTHISANAASEAGVAVSLAGPMAIEQTLRVYGRLAPHPDRIARISARFSGLVQAVAASPGDKVKANAILATIESNQSLNPYSLRTPIGGTVVERNTSLGEYAGSNPLFTIANLDIIRAQLRIFPSQLDGIAQGQHLHLQVGEQDLESSIRYLLPATDNQPYVHAVADIDNGNGRLVPGQLVEATVLINRKDVALAVPLTALQELDGEEVVFVREGEDYEARPVSIGQRDSHSVEILSGIEAGEEVVTRNSYLIKADLEKSSASHSH